MAIREPDPATSVHQLRPPHSSDGNLRSDDLLQNSDFLAKPDLKVSSTPRIWLVALAVGLLVFILALVMQWIIYDRIMHQDGVRIVGSAIAAVIATLLVQSLETSARNQRLRELRRLEVIALLNHHIRNSLQAIVASSGTSNSTDTIRVSVERIEWALGEVLPDLDPKTHKAASSSRH